MLQTKKLRLAILSCLFTVVAFAQETEEKKQFTFGGSVDAYYQTYLTSSDNNFVPFQTSFADQAGFALGMANLIASYESESGKVGAVADLVYGPRGNDAVGGDLPYVNQLYAYWNVSEKTTLTFGRFNTYLGYEVISPTGNFNYSTSHLFSSGPFSHVGLKADFALSEDFSLMLAFMNATDTNNNTTGDYALGAQLGYKGQFLNFYYDSGVVLGFEVDYTGGFDISDDFFLGINAAYQTSELAEDVNGGFYGVALYPQLATSDDFTLGLRGELFGGHLTDGEDLESVLGLTLTGSYSVENLTIKPEVRLDSWSNTGDAPFLDADGAGASSLAAFTVAAIYAF